ncbi:MAG: hypothetical protein PVF43_01575 [Candidatus Eiseniibacteriota bacterium]|jgi:hypothetical protein
MIPCVTTLAVLIVASQTPVAGCGTNAFVDASAPPLQAPAIVAPAELAEQAGGGGDRPRYGDPPQQEPVLPATWGAIKHAYRSAAL